MPPARANQVLDAGVLAGNASWRAEVVPKVPFSTELFAPPLLAEPVRWYYCDRMYLPTSGSCCRSAHTLGHRHLGLADLGALLRDAGLKEVRCEVVHTEHRAPAFTTLLAIGWR